ncbi:hypothetical protein IFT84_20495 [Rhizobium sp. CFBP 8762]|uniref:DNA primase family protein n=1 Tax=Rhizobium sp. CFBP 8762 TaxID=2775279 RepID=UPI00178200CD|nr:phage/plasmid primase, P4 family [Rhizobium sp. CFBP 8762]MBD8556892.1 hypothetical protein [Rhizobium sp. CFBP 8762]
MSKDKSKSGVPEPVVDMLARANMQRGLYNQHPDPLPVVEADEEEPSLVLSPEEILEECALEPETDIGNARRLINRYGDEILYVARVGWHGFDGKRWKEDEDGSVVRPLAHRTAEFIDDEAILLDATDEEKAMIDEGRAAQVAMKELGKPNEKWPVEKLERHEKLQEAIDTMAAANKTRKARMSSRHSHAKSSAGTSKINNMLQEAAPYVAKMVNDLNTDLYAINVRNGTLRFFCSELDGVGKWQVRMDRHRHSDYISKLAPVVFDPNAICPVFEQFFITVMPNPDIRAFMQRYIGYCLLGLTVEQCLLFLYGAGRNGKSTFVDLMVDVLGDYAVTLSIDSFAGENRRGGGDATPDLARLPGARLVAASEPEMGVKMKDALIKTLTGGEKIAVRRLQQDFFELIPQFKILLQGNHKPRVDDDSDGIWRRVHLVPFDIQIPENEVDPDLPMKLRREIPGVLAWAVRGALDYLQKGLQPPAAVKAATAEYREESDPIGAFLRNGCRITGNDNDMASPEDLFIAYSNFARKEGLPEFKKDTFNRRMPGQAQKSFKGEDGRMHQFRKGKRGTTFYFGIAVKDEFLAPQGDSPSQGRFNDEPWPDDR